jgi:acyl carrier protein
MNDTSLLEERILRLLREDMAIDVPSGATDLVEAGHLDSLLLADLLSRLENDLDFRVRIDGLDMDQIRTVAGLASFVGAHLREGA